MSITVIIPVYNEEASISACLTSLQGQALQATEVIVVDDGSVDHTVEIVKRFKVKLFRQNHQGPGAARNLGAKKAKGNILIFVDADMTFATDFIEKLTAPIRRDGKTPGVFNTAEYVSNFDNPWARCWNLNQNLTTNRRMNPKSIHDVRDFRAITKKEFEKVGGFSLTGYTDSRTLSEKLGYLPTPVKGAISYHANPASLSEVFVQARWIGRRSTRFGPFGKLINLIRYSLPVSIIVGLIKGVFYQQVGFFLFKVVYDLGFFIGIITGLTGATAK